MPLIQTQGAASVRSYGENLKTGVAVYIEDVFSTWLYSGNGTTQTITNGIDLSTKGGLVWTKSRSNVSYGAFVDTVRGIGNGVTPSSGEIYTWSSGSGGENSGWRYSDITSFNTNGYSLGYTTSTENENGLTYASWTFRKQPKFFDIVTYTGDDTTSRQISHNLGSVPGFILFKKTSNTGNWVVWHRGIPNGAYTQAYLRLNGNFGVDSFGDYGFSLIPTSTVLNIPRHSNIRNTSDSVNVAGETYVAYLFAHNAGGFGNAGTDNVISCGSFTLDGSFNATVDLGWEPQFILTKSTGSSNWVITDNMRGMPASTDAAILYPDLTNAEGLSPYTPKPTARGFTFNFVAAATFIYIAIRRGPMKTPTVGTSVFSPLVNSGSSNPRLTTNFPFDLQTNANQVAGGSGGFFWSTRLTGVNSTSADSSRPYLQSYSSVAEASASGFAINVDNIGYNKGSNWGGIATVMYNFRRAPGFFDVVCYTGSNGYQDLSHNLGVTPQMVIIKNRTGTQNWIVGLQGITGIGKYLVLNSTSAVVSDANYFGSIWTNTKVLIDGNQAPINQNGSTYVMYLFASCPGVSSVGSYTGNGSSQTINCGFTAGARFILIKRTDSTGDWYVWDSARGIVTSNDPHLSLNTTAAEVTTDDSIDTDSTGFIVNQLAATNINVTSATYIFLAIA